SPVKNDHLYESIRVYILLQQATTEAEFAGLLARLDACTDADGNRTTSQVLNRIGQIPTSDCAARPWAGPTRPTLNNVEPAAPPGYNSHPQTANQTEFSTLRSATAT